MVAILQPNIYTLRTKSDYEKKLERRFSQDIRTLISNSFKHYEEWVKTVPFGVSATHIFGPCDVYCAFPVINQKVLCGFLDNRFDEVVILGKTTTSKIVTDVDSPILSSDGANKNYIDTEILTLKQYIDNNFD